MRTTIALLAALTTATTLAAQTKTAPPNLGSIVSYQFWPTQFIQFVTGPELPLSMFEFDVDSTGKQPVYHAVLTGKRGERTHYSNVDALVAYYKATGEQSYKANFAVELDESEKVGAITTARFTAHDEKPVEFRFVQGSDISEQGAGLQPVPQSPIPVLAYRELGCVAGEGTALKIGDTVSTAEMWKEISRPPYFVGYRGAETQSASLIAMPKLTETWTVTAYPAALTAGNTWEMDNDRGNHLSVKIDKVEGARFTMSVANRQRPNQRMTVEATRTGAAAGSTEDFTTDRVLYMPAGKNGEKHATVFSFTGLNNTAATGTLEVGFAKKQKIVTATLANSGDSTDRTTATTFTAPPWLTTKSLTEEAKITANTAVITVK